ncbi:MAG: Na+/H+ antiporter NhaC [Candidatus Marinimicrobia bacterium]|nr:Na+/H+ antiporter NhaC [Candidatus Neomarinimicrobiota bacterium]
MHKTKPISLSVALLPIVFLISLLSLNVYYYGDDALSGANQITLLLSGAFCSFLAIIRGTSWSKILEGIRSSISDTLPALLILLLIGALAGTWLISGIVPAMIYYGLQIVNPTYFLIAACIVSAIISLVTGSSWSTIATIGVALLGIGKAIGMSEAMVAGAIISGAYFGDKMSPLSDTTNLAPAMAGVDLFTHIRYMSYTTIPSICITLIIFLFLGLNLDTQTSADDISIIQNAINSKFNISIWLFSVPAIVIGLIIKKTPAIPALFIGTILGGIAAVVFQTEIITELGGSNNYFQNSFTVLMDAMARDVSIVTDNSMINELLSTGGMNGMLNTVWLILCAMCFGGSMEASGFLNKLSTSFMKMATNTASLVATTTGTCVFFNLTASDQYLSIIVPGKMFSESYKKNGLAPENLSRTLEDSGTVTSVLIPWNTCGATQASVLGVSTLTYLPFCFFNIISPFMTMIYAIIGIKIRAIKA